MSFTHRTGYVNPRLGTYFGIFMALFFGLAVVVLILELLGTSTLELELAMLLGPLVLYMAVGIAASTKLPIDYFASGRRVPAFFSGLTMAQTALGGTGLVSLTGVFFLVGFDALGIVIGGLAGFVFMAVLLAPFIRKFGAFTLPSYLGRRFDSLTLRLAAGGMLAVPLLFMLAAEFKIAAFAASWLSAGSPSLAIGLFTVVLVITLGGGGMRSLTWTSSAQSLAALIAVIIPLVTIAVIVTNLPLPQLSSGPVLRALSRSEAAQGLPIILPPQLAFDIPGEGLSAIGKRFSDAFGSIGPLAFVMIMLSSLAGVATAPWLLPRVASTPGVYEARKSLGWATLLFGVLMMTLASAAIFMRDYLMDIVTVAGQVRLPDWVQSLRDMGVISIAQDQGRPTLSSFSVNRDAVLIALPFAAELPRAFMILVASGVLAAALASAGSVTVALGNIIAEDLLYGLTWIPQPARQRLVAARLGLGVVAATGALLALILPIDPLNLMLWAVGLSGASLFPVLVLSIWWKRMNEFGALAGMATGFGVTMLAIIAGEAGLSGVDSALGGAIGLPAGFIAAIAVARTTPGPSRHVLELVRDIRVPGGEILYDREMRHLSRLRTHRK